MSACMVNLLNGSRTEDLQAETSMASAAITNLGVSSQSLLDFSSSMTCSSYAQCTQCIVLFVRG